jgi:hypothetical protein
MHCVLCFYLSAQVIYACAYMCACNYVSAIYEVQRNRRHSLFNIYSFGKLDSLFVVPLKKLFIP